MLPCPLPMNASDSPRCSEDEPVTQCDIEQMRNMLPCPLLLNASDTSRCSEDETHVLSLLINGPSHSFLYEM